MNTIPEFPRSALITELSPTALQKTSPEMASDYHWLSLRSWNPEAEVSTLDGALVVAFRDYHDPDRRFFGFVGGNDPASIADTLLRAAELRDWTPELRLIPEQTLLRIGGGFISEADHDHDDYLYDPADVVDLDGPGHRLNRKQRRQFRRDHEGRYSIDMHGPSTAPWNTIIELTEAWASITADAAAASDEVKAVIRCCAALELFPYDRRILVSTLSIDARTIGYDITELCPGDWALNHFRHTPHDHRGAHAELRTFVAGHLIRSGCTSWNAEQDLGVPGLRTRKSRDRPSAFVRKFTVRSRSAQA